MKKQKTRNGRKKTKSVKREKEREKESNTVPIAGIGKAPGLATERGFEEWGWRRKKATKNKRVESVNEEFNHRPVIFRRCGMQTRKDG